MKDLDPLPYFLSIEVAFSTSRYILSQTKYALDIFNKDGLNDEKAVATLSEYNLKLSLDGSTLLDDPT